MVTNLFGEAQPEPQPMKPIRVKFFMGDIYNGDEVLACEGILLPRVSHNAPDVAEVLLDVPKCYTASSEGIISETIDDTDLQRETDVYHAPIGWIVRCLETELEVIA